MGTAIQSLGIYKLIWEASIDHTAGFKNSKFTPDFSDIVNAIAADEKIPVKNNLIGPSVSSSKWTTQQVLDGGYLTTFANSLGIVAVEQYILHKTFYDHFDPNIQLPF